MIRLSSEMSWLRASNCSVPVSRLGVGISIAMRQVLARSLLQRLAVRLLLLLFKLLGQVSSHGLVEAGLVVMTPVSQLLRSTSRPWSPWA